jgi:4-carboxymuconolactone decarboxylase
MPNQPETLGGRLPLLDAQKLTSGQKEIYDLLDNTLIPWAASSGFQSKTETGKFIGPFNPLLFSPGITRSFVQLQIDEAKNTTLTERVRQVIILTVGAVWQSDYERYAHAAVARKAGISEEAIRTLMAGGLQTISASRRSSPNVIPCNSRLSTGSTRLFTMKPSKLSGRKVWSISLI